MNTLTISPIRAFSDNYIWLIARNKQAFVVDLGEPGLVLAALRAENVQAQAFLLLITILTIRVLLLPSRLRRVARSGARREAPLVHMIAR